MDLYRQALIDLGLDVFDVPLDAFSPPDLTRIHALISDLKVFGPDLAVGLSHGVHLLACALPPRRDGWRPNLFTDVLDLPTICIWDHAPLDVATQLLEPHPKDPAASKPGARELVRRILTHPRMIHWSRDTGQTKLMLDLRFALPGSVIHEPPPALPGFEWQQSDADTGVSFVGHVYQSPVIFPDRRLNALSDRAIAAWIEDPGRPHWRVLHEHVLALGGRARRSLALESDQTYYWHYAHSVILHRAQTAVRLKMLGGAGVPVMCYGDLRADAPGVPRNLVPISGEIPFGPPLAAALRRHAITLDVMNPGFVRGFSHKPILAWASGGFLLMDRKQDFVDAFGEAGEAVSYRSAEELGSLVERFLGNPRYRREVGREIRDRIAARFRLHDVLSRLLCAAAGSRAFHQSRFTTPEPPAGNARRSVLDLLPAIRTSPDWKGAVVEYDGESARLTTSPRRWAYAAALNVPANALLVSEPHLRIDLVVEEGAIGLAILDSAGELSAEQCVSASRAPATVVVELPRGEASTVILRNCSDGVSRAVVLRAELCDRN